MKILCHGCFDLLHIGHIYYLKSARKLGTYLIVTITADRYITKPGRPVFTQDQRKEMLESLRFVDEVAIIEDATAIPAIERYKPDFYCKGIDYSDSDCLQLQAERECVEKYGGRLVIIDTPKYSSTDLLSGRLLNK